MAQCLVGPENTGSSFFHVESLCLFVSMLYLHLTSVFVLFALHARPESCLHVPLQISQPLSVLPPILPSASFLVLLCHLFIRLRAIWSIAYLVICASMLPDDFIFSSLKSFFLIFNHKMNSTNVFSEFGLLFLPRGASLSPQISLY